MTERLLAAAVLAGLVAVLVTRLAEVVARRRSLLDHPNDRSSHIVPTPRLGGLGIAAGAVTGWLVAGGLADPTATVIMVAALGLAAVGLLDDLWRTSVLGKYLAQLVASAVVAVALAPTLRIGFADAAVVVDGPVAMAVVAVGLTALVNAVNFMDGIDGLIGAVSLVGALLAIGLSGAGGWPIVVPLAAACLGFLVWNWAPASIFMGDAGSQFLGLLLGAALLHREAPPVDVLPVLVLAAPLLWDTGFTLVRRARAGRDLFAGHREHLYQRLVQSGASHRAVAAGYAAATGATGVIALAWSTAPSAVQVIVLAGLVVLGLGYAGWVSGRERRASEVATAAVD